MKFRVILDKAKEEEVVATVHRRTNLIDEIEALILRDEQTDALAAYQEEEDTEEAQVNDDAMQRVVRIMEKRVNELGLTEPIIQRQGARRIIVELPGIKDPDGVVLTLSESDDGIKRF